MSTVDPSPAVGTPVGTPADTSADTHAELAWCSWPLRDETPAKSLLLILSILGTSVLAGWMGGLTWALLALALLFILLGPYLLPTRYGVSARGVEVRFPLFNRQRVWSHYRRYVIQADGVFLGTLPQPSRLDSFRGDFLRFNRQIDGSRVVALVQANVKGGQP